MKLFLMTDVGQTTAGDVCFTLLEKGLMLGWIKQPAGRQGRRLWRESSQETIIASPVAPSTLVLSTRIRRGGTFISILEAGAFVDLAHTKSGTLHLQLDGPNSRRERTHSTNPTSKSRSSPLGSSSRTAFKPYPTIFGGCDCPETYVGLQG